MRKSQDFQNRKKKSNLKCNPCFSETLLYFFKWQFFFFYTYSPKRLCSCSFHTNKWANQTFSFIFIFCFNRKFETIYESRKSVDSQIYEKALLRNTLLTEFNFLLFSCYIELNKNRNILAFDSFDLRLLFFFFLFHIINISTFCSELSLYTSL